MGLRPWLWGMQALRLILALGMRLADPAPVNVYREANRYGIAASMALARTLDIPLWTGDGQFYRAVQDDPLVRWIGEVTTCPSGAGNPSSRGVGSPLPLYASSASSRRPGIGQITIRLASTSISRTTSRMAGMRTSPKGPRTTYTSLARV